MLSQEGTSFLAGIYDRFQKKIPLRGKKQGRSAAEFHSFFFLVQSPAESFSNSQASK